MIKMAYIAGPVTGLPDRNRPAFEAARLEVGRITGAGVTIPHDFVQESDAETTAMGLCLAAIFDMVKLGVPFFVVLLPGWRASLGTAVEVALARKLGVPVVELVDGALIELESVILCTDKQTNECPRCGNSNEHSNPGTSDQEGQRG
jgi:hypothetical protein